MVSVVTACPKALVVVAVVVMGLAWPAHAQVGGTIQGTVKDAQDAVLPGVTLALRNVDTGVARSAQEVAEGFLQIAVANMANAIKQVSVQKGHDATRFALQCFGGAGGQHACLVADALGMETVFVHPFAGVLSAYGMGLADQTAMREQAVETQLTDAALAGLNAVADRLGAEASAALIAQGATPADIATTRQLHLRYAGTEAALIVPLRDVASIVADFTAAHRARFGFATPDRPLIAETVAVEAVAKGEAVREAQLPARSGAALAPVDRVTMFSGGASHAARIASPVAPGSAPAATAPAATSMTTVATACSPAK